MTKPRHVVFVLNLLQDVSVVRPLAYLAARDLDVRILFLVSAAFLERDLLRKWQREVARICADTYATVRIFEAPADAVIALQGRQGILIAASESDLAPHALTHDVMRAAPSSFLRVTLQHGYECVGFLQNREHVIAHGRNIRFAADVVCGWCEAPALKDLASSERPKLYVSGAPMLLNRTRASGPPAGGGLVCENLHSVRMRTSGDFAAAFMDVFNQACARLASVPENVTLRPHPGGMYVVKNKVPLPPNVRLDLQPIYETDLRAFSYGISAPSTVVLDMVFAGLPVAVWRDGAGIMDTSNYEGLTAISSFTDWLEFIRDALVRREEILERQAAFIRRLRMPVDPREVHGRFARLLASGTPCLGDVTSGGKPHPFVPKRMLFIANAVNATLQISFLSPLRPLLEAGGSACRVITETDLMAKAGDRNGKTPGTRAEHHQWAEEILSKELESFAPDLILCCRYSGAGTDRIASFAEARGIPLVYHIDDDMMNVPPEIGAKKHRSHNHPDRLDAVDTMLRRSTLVYCSTAALRQRFRHLGYATPMRAGRLQCPGTVIVAAGERPVTRVGYMGYDKENDFRVMLPELVRYLRRNTGIVFELFGSIPKPAELDEFGSRIVVVEPVRDYGRFLATLAARNWDIGICPLAATPFNAMKSNNKWVEYTSVGAATVATAGLIYDDCCSGGCGLLVREGEWLAALERLTDDPAGRAAMVARAQDKLKARYRPEDLRDQVLEVFSEAAERVRARTTPAWRLRADPAIEMSRNRPVHHGLGGA